MSIDEGYGRGPLPKTESQEEWMKRRLDHGDSRRLPITGRDRSDLIPLVYREHEVVVRAFSVALVDERKTKFYKEGVRQLIRDWLKRNGISRNDVVIEGRELPLDYGTRFMAWARCKKAVVIHVPPFGDEWWRG